MSGSTWPPLTISVSYAAIAMRFHATIFALSQGLRTIGVDYRVGGRDKVAALLGDFGQSENCCRIDTMTSDWLATRLADGLTAVFADAGVPVVVPRVGSLLGIFFIDTAPTNFDEASAAADNGIYPRFFHGMLERGIALAPGPYEAIFVSTTHTEALVDDTIAAAADVAPTLLPT